MWQSLVEIKHSVVYFGHDTAFERLWCKTSLRGALNRSFVLQCFACGNAVETHNGLMLDFNAVETHNGLMLDFHPGLAATYVLCHMM